MRILKNLSVGVKGLMSVTELAVLIVIMGIISLNNLHSINNASKEISDNYAESIALMGKISSDFESLNQVIYGHIIANSDSAKSVYTQKSKTLSENIDSNCKKFEVNLNEGQEKENYTKFQSLYKQYTNYYNQALTFSNNNQDDEAVDIINSQISNYSEQIETAINAMNDANESAMEEAKTKQTNTYNASVTITFIILAVAFICLMFAVIIVIFEISRPVRRMSRQLNVIIDGIKNNDGDLTKRVEAIGKDEIGQLGAGINVFVDTLQAIMKQIQDSTTSLNSIVDNVVNKVTTANDDSNEISSVMQELSASMEEVSSTVANIETDTENVDGNVNELADASEKLMNYTTQMQQRASALENTAVENRQSTSEIVNNIINKLQTAIEESKSIDKVNELTDEILNISSQTNLLALNASIEAARAGEVGKGFAVVADEISKLASSSRETANNIQNINHMVIEAVKGLIDSSNQIVSYVNDNILPDYEGFVDAGKQYNNDAEYINETVVKFNDMADEIKKIMNNITDAMAGIATVIDESSNGVSSAALNTNDMVKDIGLIASEMDNNKQIAEVLDGEVRRFRRV